MGAACLCFQGFYSFLFVIVKLWITRLTLQNNDICKDWWICNWTCFKDLLGNCKRGPAPQGPCQRRYSKRILLWQWWQISFSRWSQDVGFLFIFFLRYCTISKQAMSVSENKFLSTSSELYFILLIVKLVVQFYMSMHLSIKIIKSPLPSLIVGIIHNFKNIWIFVKL